WYFRCFFFFQAEDGIRDFHVTGVQTCALPISDDGLHITAARIQVNQRDLHTASVERGIGPVDTGKGSDRCHIRILQNPLGGHTRSEERRVGKESTPRWDEYHKNIQRIIKEK